MTRILLVEDDQAIAQSLTYALEAEGYQVTHCAGVRACERVLPESFQLAILDVSLPDGSGFDLCRTLRQQQTLPVIFLTVNNDEADVVRGLDMGADDYIAKPFRLNELLSRVRNVLRRSAGEKEEIEIGDLVIDVKQGRVYKGGAELGLTALEYRLLLIFASHRGRLLSRERLLEQIWDISGEFVNDNTLTVYIKRLREKLAAEPEDPAYIQTVRGLGYRLGE